MDWTDKLFNDDYLDFCNRWTLDPYGDYAKQQYYDELARRGEAR